MQQTAILDRGAVVASIEGPVAHVELNRDDKRNAINSAMADAFTSVAAELPARGVTTAVLAARGSTFCAGVDLKERREPGQPPPFEPMLQALRTGDVLWVAAIEGGAVGAGVALALSCPVVVMAADAFLWLPELSKIGRMPMGVIRWAAPIIGTRAAIDLAVTERRLGAQEAWSRGWATEVATDGALPAALGHARRVGAADADSVRAAAARWSAAAPSPSG